MSDVIPIEENSERDITDVYNELTLQLCHLQAVTTLIQSADPVHMPKLAFNGVGYALEELIDGVKTRAEELFEIGGVK